jgi:hypothetical protein
MASQTLSVNAGGRGADVGGLPSCDVARSLISLHSKSEKSIRIPTEATAVENGSSGTSAAMDRAH